MTFQEFDSKLKKHVAELPYEQQLDLALDVCKKLFFDYQRFCEENKWGNPDILLDAIHFLERSKAGTPYSDQIAEIIKKVEEATPDTEYFGDANYALNACIAVYYTLTFLLENKPEYIYYVGTSLYDTVDARVQGDDDLSEEEIDGHPMMVQAKEYLLQEIR